MKYRGYVQNGSIVLDERIPLVDGTPISVDVSSIEPVPATGDPANGDPATALPRLPIGDGLACHRCGYNLRGLFFDGLCPECGESIARSIEFSTAPFVKLLGNDPENMANRLLYQQIAEESETTVDAVLFLLDSVKQMCRENPAVQLEAAAICAAVGRRARTYFNDPSEARELLQEWGLSTGEDIGRIVQALARHELLRMPQEALAQFSGEFSLEHELIWNTPRPEGNVNRE